jgi:hypothetical protein
VHLQFKPGQQYKSHTRGCLRPTPDIPAPASPVLRHHARPQPSYTRPHTDFVTCWNVLTATHLQVAGGSACAC